MKKRILSLVLAAIMTLGLTGCGEIPPAADPAPPQASSAPAESAPAVSSAPAEEEAFTPGEFSIAALKGPTAMGLAKLMDTVDKGGETANQYTFTLAGAADEVTPKLIKGELDMACVPANLAATLYQKTEGAIQVLAVNTLGVIYIVENGDTLQSMADLKGKTIVAHGKGSTPEFGLRYLLKENGIDPDADLTIEWKSEHSECVAALAAGTASIALLPQPFVTVAQTKLPGLRVALDLTAEWDALDNGSTMITGVIVGRRDTVSENPEAVAAFLREYHESVEWVNANVTEAAAIIGGYGIVDAAVAEKALPYCNIVCLVGKQMQDKLSGYLDALYAQEPGSVGGAVPAEDFYFVD